MDKPVLINTDHGGVARILNLPDAIDRPRSRSSTP